MSIFTIVCERIKFIYIVKMLVLVIICIRHPCIASIVLLNRGKVCIGPCYWICVTYPTARKTATQVSRAAFVVEGRRSKFPLICGLWNRSWFRIVRLFVLVHGCTRCPTPAPRLILTLSLARPDGIKRVCVVESVTTAIPLSTSMKCLKRYKRREGDSGDHARYMLKCKIHLSWLHSSSVFPKKKFSVRFFFELKWRSCLVTCIQNPFLYR